LQYGWLNTTMSGSTLQYLVTSECTIEEVAHKTRQKHKLLLRNKLLTKWLMVQLSFWYDFAKYVLPSFYGYSNSQSDSPSNEQSNEWTNGPYNELSKAPHNDRGIAPFRVVI
jgi:hypothetical protein